MNPRLNVSIFCRGGVARWDLFLREIESSLSISLKKRPHLATPPLQKIDTYNRGVIFFPLGTLLFLRYNNRQNTGQRYRLEYNGFPQNYGHFAVNDPLFLFSLFLCAIFVAGLRTLLHRYIFPPPFALIPHPPNNNYLGGSFIQTHGARRDKKKRKTKGNKKTETRIFPDFAFFFCELGYSSILPIFRP